MSPKVPEEKIAQVREATDIVDLISNYLTLKRSGKGFVGLCPFHEDSAPSFRVDPNTQLYYCFGCQRGGNVFNFLMESEKMNFMEALEFLAEKAGISLPRTSVDDQAEKEKEALYHANRWAANLFYKNLTRPTGKEALQYLEKRGIYEKTVKAFGLGYSLPSWDGLIQQAKKDAISIEVLEKAGLIIRRSGGGHYDRFRGRFMIPIVNLYKKVLGFGGRLIANQENQPKYINTPETLIYKKGSILFGLYQSRQAIREQDQAIFVEGYTDLISLFQAGVKNVVATSGTALTPNQVRLIKRFTNNIVLIYDSDTAGSMAAMRGADIFLSQDVDVNIVTLPANTDPDSFIQEHGVLKFNQILEHGLTFIQFKINMLTQKYDAHSSAGTMSIVNELLASVAQIRNSIKINLAVKEIAEHFSLDERSLMQQLKNIKRSGGFQSLDYGKKAPPKIVTKSKYDVAEEDLIRLIVEDVNWLPKIFSYLTLGEIQNQNHRHLFEIVLKLFEQSSEVDKTFILKNISDPDIASEIATILHNKIDKNADRQRLFEDCIVILKKRRLETQLHNIAKEIKIAEDKNQDNSEYVKKYQQYRKDISEIEKKLFLKDE